MKSTQILIDQDTIQVGDTFAAVEKEGKIVIERLELKHTISSSLWDAWSDPEDEYWDTYLENEK